VTVRLLHSTISGNKQPVTVLKVTEKLQKDGFGQVIQNNTTTALFTCLPCEVKVQDLGCRWKIIRRIALLRNSFQGGYSIPVLLQTV